MPRDVDFILLFEKAVRELDVACALQYILAKKHDLTVEIVQQNRPPARLFSDLRPAVVVLPFAYQARSNNAYLIRWRDATFFNLTWEQFLYAGNRNAKTPRGVFALRHVIHNAWSEEYAGVLRREGVPDDHIFVSGNPAYSLYDEPYRRYFRSRQELASGSGLDPGRRWVFFPENYNWAFYSDAMLRQMTQDGQPVEQVMAMRDVVTRSFEAAMRWCARAAQSGRVELIVRPRPATLVDDFRRRAEAVVGRLPPRLSIIQTDTVRDWILASDIVVSSYSTSLIEASIARKPARIVEPIPWPSALRQVWHDLVPRIRSESEFVDLATGSGATREDTRLEAWARATVMAKGDAIVMLADHLAAIRRGEVPIPLPAPWRSLTLPGHRGIPPRLMLELRRRFRSPEARSDIPIDEEIREDVAAVTGIPGRVARWDAVLRDYLAGPTAAR